MTDEEREQVKREVYNQIVNSKAFLARFPEDMPAEEFVDGLKGDKDLRNAWVGLLRSDGAKRAEVFRAIVERG